MKPETKNNRVFLKTSFDQKEDVKQIPGRKWHPDIKRWSVPYDEDTVELVKAYLNIDISPPKISIANDKNAVDDVIIKKLYEHQRQSIAVARQTNNCADLSEPGTGKTLVQIELMLERNVWPVLVVCPKSIMEAVWQEQLKEFNLTPIILNNGSQAVKNTIAAFKPIYPNDSSDTVKYDVFIINYEMVSLVINELMMIPWQYIILDESTKIKSPTAKRSKAIMKLRQMPSYKSIMTGTVAPNGLQDAFNQFKFIEPRIFGESFYAFRQRYFTQGGYMNYEWFPRPDSLERFKTKINGISIQHHKRDCADLPPLVKETRYAVMERDQETCYNAMKEECLVALNETTSITAPFVTTKLMKLRQIASGFIYTDKDTYKVTKANPKGIVLKEILEELKEEKVIIFAHFNETINYLHDLLKEKSVMFYGPQKQVAVEMFKKNIQYFIANPASAGHGLNLQFCSNVIYFENDFNLENYLQSMQRIERIGQKNKMTVFYIIVKKTLEGYILSKLEKKEDINKKLDISELKRSL